jgi:hypothetical protein
MRDPVQLIGKVLVWFDGGHADPVHRGRDVDEPDEWLRLRTHLPAGAVAV